MRKHKDAYGAELLAARKSHGVGVLEIIERDDGFISASPLPVRYFSEYSAWSRREKQAVRLVQGRVLDVGAGAGRFALHLQKLGHEVTAIDNSPGAIKVCKLRGVKKAQLRPIVEIRRFEPASFDTVIMMGNNFGLFGGYRRAKRLLKDFDRITSRGGQIIAETTDPYRTRDSLHLGYHRFNRERGRMSGQLKLRVRHEKTIGEWFDYLLVSRKELKEIVAGSGWRIAKIVSGKGSGYMVVLKKSVLAPAAGGTRI
ncbi:MAG TPA: class I SAM-dependent methyltransferase [Candidatus Angelobacter sp.]